MNIQKMLFVILIGGVFLLTSSPFLAPSRAEEPPQKVVVVPLFHDQSPAPSFLSIPFTAFVGPYDGLGALLNTGACW